MSLKAPSAALIFLTPWGLGSFLSQIAYVQCKKKKEAYIQTNIRIILTYFMSAACPCKRTFVHLGKNHSVEECDACVHRVSIPEIPLPKYVLSYLCVCFKYVSQTGIKLVVDIHGPQKIISIDLVDH